MHGTPGPSTFGSTSGPPRCLSLGDPDIGPVTAPSVPINVSVEEDGLKQSGSRWEAAGDGTGVTGSWGARVLGVLVLRPGSPL